MNRKWIKLAAVLAVIMMLLMTGCNFKKSPGRAMEGAIEKMKEADRFAFESTLKTFEFDYPASFYVGRDPAEAEMLVKTIKNMITTYNGKVQLTPFHMDVERGQGQEGDLTWLIKSHSIIKGESIYVKAPRNPFTDSLHVSDTYRKLEMKDLAEEVGGVIPDNGDFELAYKFISELVARGLANFDQKEFFTDVSVEEANLPEDIKATRVVKFSLNDDNLAQAASIIINDVLPVMLDVLEKEEYSKLIVNSTVEELKNDFKEFNHKDLEDGLLKMKEHIKVKEISLTMAISADGYPTYTSIIVNIVGNFEGESMELGVRLNTKFNDINKEQQFRAEPTETIPMEGWESNISFYKEMIKSFANIN